MRHSMGPVGLLFTVSLFSPLIGTGFAAEGDEIRELRKDVEELLRVNRQQQKQIERLQRRLEAMEGASTPEPAPASALDRAVEELETAEPERADTAPPPAIASRRVGGVDLRLIDISLDLLVAAGGSSLGGEELRRLQGGGHDPRKRGFTLQNLELSLMGAIDPYLTGEAHLIYFIDAENGESIFELEEAFFTTQALPYAFQVEAGQFFTEFGRINPRHPHQWDWLDQPVINTRLFGPDGLRAVGSRVGWLTPLPWFSELHAGVQNADQGETTVSFIGEEGIGGRPAVERDVRDPADLLYLARWNNSWDLTPEWTSLLGVSGLFGPNASGEDGRTYIYGADLTVKWRPLDHFRGWPFLIWQSEVMKRDYRADSASVSLEGEGEELLVDLPSAILRDWGLYSQILYGFRTGWAAGARYDFAAGSGATVGGRSNDPFRDDRHRLSPLLVWHPSEFSRFRLQYNYDNADHLDSDAHSVWLGAEILYGAHPAHTY